MTEGLHFHSEVYMKERKVRREGIGGETQRASERMEEEKNTVLPDV